VGGLNTWPGHRPGLSPGKSTHHQTVCLQENNDLEYFTCHYIISHVIILFHMSLYYYNGPFDDRTDRHHPYWVQSCQWCPVIFWGAEFQCQETFICGSCHKHQNALQFSMEMKGMKMVDPDLDTVCMFCKTKSTFCGTNIRQFIGHICYGCDLPSPFEINKNYSQYSCCWCPFLSCDGENGSTVDMVTPRPPPELVTPDHHRFHDPRKNMNWWSGAHFVFRLLTPVIRSSPCNFFTPSCFNNQWLCKYVRMKLRYCRLPAPPCTCLTGGNW